MLRGAPAVALLTGRGARITTADRTIIDINAGSPRWPGYPTVTLRPGQSASAWLVWGNECHGLSARRVQVTWLGETRVVAMNPINGFGPDPCMGPGFPSTLDVGILRPADDP